MEGLVMKRKHAIALLAATFGLVGLTGGAAHAQSNPGLHANIHALDDLCRVVTDIAPPADNARDGLVSTVAHNERIYCIEQSG